MANYKITSQSAYENGETYITLRITFADQYFNQQIVSNKTGKELEDQLQAYVDDYEVGFNALLAQTIRGHL